MSIVWALAVLGLAVTLGLVDQHHLDATKSQLHDATDLANEAVKQRDDWRDIAYRFANGTLERPKLMDMGGFQMACCRIEDHTCKVDLIMPEKWISKPADAEWCNR